MLEDVTAEFGDDVVFLALGGLSDTEDLAARAEQWFPSGRIVWAHDEDLALWGALGVAGTPTTITIDSDGRVAAAWSGERGREFMRAQILELLTAG